MTSSALRVGLVVPRYAPFRCGMEPDVAHAAAALAARGAEVTVVTVCDGHTVETLTAAIVSRP